MKYLYDIIAKIIKGKQLRIVQMDEVFLYIDNNNDNEILFCEEKIKLTQDDIVDLGGLYRFIRDSGDADFIGNISVNKNTNVQLGYYDGCYRIDNQPNLLLTDPNGIQRLFIDLHDYLDEPEIEIKFDCYFVVNNDDRNKLRQAPYIISNVNGKLLTLVDTNWHVPTIIGTFNNIDEIKTYYKTDPYCIELAKQKQKKE